MDFIDHYNNNIQIINNRTLSLIQFNHSWIFPLFILSLFGILLTLIILFLFLYYSIYRLNNHLILTNLFICFSVCFIYITVIFYLIHANELFCGLREFLSQFAYVLLYSALLCRYIMQWLTTRILSKKTKHLISLLIYFLLIFIQIPIGILWWYFTIPRMCQQQIKIEYPKLKFHFKKRITSIKSCSYQCIVDYRFYATYTFIILELILCTIIAICLFLCHHCHRNKTEKNQFIQINNNKLLTFLNMFAFILIDISWLIWTFIYYFTHPIYVYPSFVIGMFTIGTICLFFILIPQIYFYSKIKINSINIPKTTIFSNKLASIEDIKDHDLFFHEKYIDEFHHNKHQTLSNRSELSYELGTSGTFLPITRTPKGPFKVTNIDKTIPIEKLDKLIYGEHRETPQISNNKDKSITNKRKINTPVTDITNQQEQPLEHQLTSSSIASDFVKPFLKTEHLHQSNSNIHSSYVPLHHDETFIPILYSTQHRQPPSPVKMRTLIKSPSSSVPITRRIYSGIDHRYIRHPYHHMLPPPPPPPATPLYYSPLTQQQYLFVDPYRPMPSYSGDNLWQSVLPLSHRYPYVYNRFRMDNRSLSQRLWDMDSDDDQDENEENILNIHDRATPTRERLKDFHLDHIENDDQTILHNDNDDDEENSDNKKIIHI